MKLIYDKTGEPVKIGDDVTTSRGEPAKVTGWAEPRHQGSTGRVRLKGEFAHFGEYEYYPSVIDAHWAEG